MTHSARESVIQIDRRFNGPPDSANGGYVCGLLAGFLDGPAEVTLRLPPPLETPLRMVHEGADVRLYDGERMVAEAVPADLELDVPPPPSWEQAEAAVPGYPGFADHALPTCFVCGTHRPEDDGLRLFTGPVAGREDGLLACPWTPDASLADDTGLVRPEMIWAALDCPGAFAVQWANPGSLCLLGRLTARVEARPRIGERCIATGWPIGRDGRKRFAGTAVFSEAGAVLGAACAVWIELKQNVL